RLGLEHAGVLVRGRRVVLLAIGLPLAVERQLVLGARDVLAVDQPDRAVAHGAAAVADAGAEEEDEAADEGADGQHDERPPDRLGALVAHSQLLEHSETPCDVEGEAREATGQSSRAPAAVTTVLHPGTVQGSSRRANGVGGHPWSSPRERRKAA